MKEEPVPPRDSAIDADVATALLRDARCRGWKVIACATALDALDLLEQTAIRAN